MHPNLHKNDDRLEHPRDGRRLRTARPPAERDDPLYDEEDLADIRPSLQRTLYSLARGSRLESNEE